MKPYLVKMKDHYFIGRISDKGKEERICIDEGRYFAFKRDESARKFAMKNGIELEEQVIDRSDSEDGFLH
jgi:hypothetical protein